MSNPISNLSKLDLLRPQDLNCNIFSVYDYNDFSIQELLCTFFEKINECVDISNATFKLAEWLVSVGLKQEVAITLNKWLADGTLKEIINEEIFSDLNNKIDKVESYLITNVAMYGADNTGVKPCSNEIQQCIDYVSSKGGGIVQFGKGTYLLDKPLYLPSYVQLVGEGMQGATVIERVASGSTTLSKSIDYKTISREEILKYDSMVCVENEGVYWGIKNIEFKSRGDVYCQWGVLAPLCALFTIDSVQTGKFNEHFRIFNAWNTNWNSVRCIRGKYGIRLQHVDESFIDTACTSWVFNRVFVEYVDFGYWFLGLQYSALNSICADQINKRAYTFDFCYGVSINGMGCENSTGQLIRNHMSQITINGGFFLAIKPGDFPSDAISQALIELDTRGRLGTGIILNSALFKNNTSGKKLLYCSDHGNITCTNVRVNDGSQIEDVDTNSQGGFTFDNPYNVKVLGNKTFQTKDLSISKINSGYSTRELKHYPGISIYNDVGNSGTVGTIRIPRSELQKNFSWVVGTDNYPWIPLKISVTSSWQGSCNHIWNAHNAITSTGKIVFGTDVVQEITTDSNDLIITLVGLQERIKIAISVA